MLKKLMKYEFKSTLRYLLPLYTTFLIITCISKILLCLTSYEARLSFIPVLLNMIFYILFIGFIVSTFFSQIIRYYGSMVTDEAYITFSLPVDVKRLTGAKLITAVVNNCISIFLGILGMVIMFFTLDEAQNKIRAMKVQIQYMADSLNINIVLLVCIVVVMMVITFATYNLFIYTAIAIGQSFQGNKLVGTFFAGMVMYMSMMIVLIPVFLIINGLYSKRGTGSVTSFIMVCIGLLIGFNILFFKIIDYLFTNKLNLD